MMTSLKGMDELFQGKVFENVLDWTKKLKMALEVQGYDELKLFKIAMLNLQGKAKDWYKKLEPTPID
jgi:hypothetical protein